MTALLAADPLERAFVLQAQVMSLADLDRAAQAEDRAAEAQRRLAQASSELTLLREDREVLEAELAASRAEIEEMRREVSAALTKLAETERAAHDSRELAARREIDAAANHSSELAAACRRATDAERAAEKALQGKVEAEDRLRSRELETQKARLELESVKREMDAMHAR